MNHLQHECWRYHEMIQRFGFWIGTFEQRQQEQDVKIQIGELNVHDEMIHIDIIFSGEITTDLKGHEVLQYKIDKYHQI